MFYSSSNVIADCDCDHGNEQRSEVGSSKCLNILRRLLPPSLE